MNYFQDINHFLKFLILAKFLHSSKWILFGVLSISVGLYPLLYFVIDRNFGLLSSKTQVLLTDFTWNFAFYGHIILGGIALLIGWMQFHSRLRKNRPRIHRNIGRVYLLAVLISGSCGLYIAQFATGGVSNQIAFSLSALIWLTTSMLAFTAIRNHHIRKHQEWMIYSYAICFSAVTLRIWLPLLIIVFGEFPKAYLIVGWLSWVPNLLVAYFLILRLRRKEQPGMAA